MQVISSMKKGLADERIKWTNPAYIHITLAFLGDTDDDITEDVRKMLNTRCGGSGKFELMLKGSGVFKNFNDPKVIWAGLESSEDLMNLNKMITEGLKDTGVHIEERPFNPHLTLGRIKYLKDRELLRRIIDNYRDTEIQKVPVNEVILYESILLPSGPLYEPLEKVEL